jgi:hypothetical protein
MNYIPTMRIKEWKPFGINSRSIMQSNRSYCYIDNDSNHNIQDLMMRSDKKCSDPTNPLRASAPFITNMFENDRVDLAHSFPFNKCIIELDNTKINNDTLRSFYEVAEGMTCDGTFSEYHRSNVRLEASNVILGAHIAASNSIKSANAAIIERNTSILAKQQFDLAKLQEQIRHMTAENLMLANTSNALAKEITSSVNGCAREIIALTAAKTTCVASNQTYSRMFEEIQVNFNLCNDIYKKKKVKYEVDQIGLSNLVDQEIFLRESIVRLNTDIEDTWNKQVQCSAQSNTCMTLKMACNKKYTETVAKIKSLKSNIEICNIDINRYYSSNDLCGEERARKEALREKTVLIYQECAKALDICQESLEAIKSKNAFMVSNTWEWDRTHLECAYEPYIANSNAEIEEILRWCKLDVDKAVKYENAYLTSHQDMINIKGDDLVACTMGENTLPVVPPKQLPPEQQETAGKPGPAPVPIPIPQPCATFYLHPNFTGANNTVHGEVSGGRVDGWMWGTGQKKTGNAVKELSSLIICPRTHVTLYAESVENARKWDNWSYTEPMKLPDMRHWYFDNLMVSYDIRSLGALQPACT